MGRKELINKALFLCQICVMRPHKQVITGKTGKVEKTAETLGLEGLDGIFLEYQNLMKSGPNRLEGRSTSRCATPA